MKTLSVDIETFNEQDIKKVGGQKYSTTSEVILFGFGRDRDPVECIDLLSGQKIPDDVLAALTDPSVIKYAHNAPFEIANLCEALGIPFLPEQWRCSQVLSAVGGYPLSLDESSKALGTAEQKDKEGSALIRYFCMPCKPTKANGGRTRNMPWHAPEKWAKFIVYCKQDVVTEQAITDKLSWVRISEEEQRLWVLDQHINRRGWKVDLELVNAAIEMDRIFRDELMEEGRRISGLENPNSPAQLIKWLSDTEGVEVLDLTADNVKDMLKYFCSPTAIRMLEIRQELSKTSIKKYFTMLASVGSDGRLRGLFQFYGAGRTGRWAGRMVQVQNLPKITYEDIMFARELVKNRDFAMVKLCFGSLSQVLSQLIRPTFTAENGNRLLIVDFSSIEAKILAWVADEEWALEVFRTHGKIYEATAARMWNIPIEEVTKAQRQRGKVGTLLLGYQGGVDAMVRMGALDMGLSLEELDPLKKMWRSENKNIVQLWYDVQAAAMRCIETGEQQVVGKKGIDFVMKNGTLLLNLPSRRSLYFPRAEVVHFIEKKDIYLDVEYSVVATRETKKAKLFVRTDMIPRKRIDFWTVDPITTKWGKSTTYGGKLVENICQAIARDCLANAMLNLDAVGIKIVAHVHDEIIAEMPERVSSIEEMKTLMLRPLPWMAGLPLGAEGDESLFYNK